jgi:hypothetical protein
MSTQLLFALGSVVFIATAAATLWFGYSTFRDLYRADLATQPESVRTEVVLDPKEGLEPVA